MLKHLKLDGTTVVNTFLRAAHINDTEKNEKNKERKAKEREKQRKNM